MQHVSNTRDHPSAALISAQTNAVGARNDLILRGKQPAGAGKLHEIDLGPDATRLNVLRTQAAAARINDQGIYVEEPQPAPTGPKAKFRRGRRQRRTSEDLQRDQLVDKILAEAKREPCRASLQPLTPSQSTCTHSPRILPLGTCKAMSVPPMTCWSTNSRASSTTPCRTVARLGSPCPRLHRRPEM
jgi:hypothetical protein